jgi:hypothetical protein
VSRGKAVVNASDGAKVKATGWISAPVSEEEVSDSASVLEEDDPWEDILT